MRSVLPMKAAKIGYIILSVLYCALGILLITMPELSITALGILLGIGMIVFGIVKIVGYFSKDLFRLAFQYDLAFGGLLIALGIIVLVNPEHLLSFFCIVMGIAVLCDGLFKIQIAIDSKPFGISTWWLILLFAVITVAAGVLLIIRPAQAARVLMVFLGISMLADGILNLIVALFTVKIIDHQFPDEDKYVEVDDD
mgnify:CR=1 FL=1